MDLLMWHLIINGRMPTWGDLLFYAVALTSIVWLMVWFANRKPKKRKKR